MQRKNQSELLNYWVGKQGWLQVTETLKKDIQKLWIHFKIKRNNHEQPRMSTWNWQKQKNPTE